jgi:Cu/Ag efflux pump CusA
MERLIEVGGRMPGGVAPVLGPVSTGLGESTSTRSIWQTTATAN